MLVLALDGLDPEAVDLLLAEGKLPALARMRREGAYGRLRSRRPLLSPVVWTTIATGKTPDLHGIGHFTAVNPRTGEELPATSRMRRVKALWNVASEAGREVAVVGWWATWPAESVKGAIVSDHVGYHFLFPQAGGGAPDPGGRVHPPGLEAELAPLLLRPQDVGGAELARYARVAPAELERPFDFRDDLSHLRWALAAAESHRRVGLELWRRRRPDLALVYVEATDSVAHLFGHLFRARGLEGELRAQQERYGGAVEAIYERADEIVGEFLAAADRRTTVVVLSDHGFLLGQAHDDPSRTRDLRRVSERFHREEGVIFLWGHRVKRRVRVQEAGILDVAPTVLRLLGLSPARDMPGRVLRDALELPPDERAVESYETGAAPHGEAARDPGADAELLERLRSLGYLDAESPEGERNLAALAFEGGRFEEAEAAYARLVARAPDDAALRTSWAGALGALGRHEEALVQLEEALRREPLNPEAYHNRAVIRERRGDREGALADYRQALRAKPGYEPSRAALARLGAPPAPPPARAPDEARAAALLEEAKELARRGDYPGALARVERARALAPDLALVHQYRANLAWLRGDREEARRALERALELDPENPLYRANLERLRAPSPPPAP